MARLHNNMDIYVGNDLRWTTAQVIDQFHQHRLVVKTRNPQGGAWEEVLVLTETEEIVGNTTQWAWEGTDPEGEKLRVTGVRRNSGCSSCGGSR